MSRPNTPTYKTLNWPSCNKALKRRGALTIWFDPGMAWAAQPTGKRGRHELPTVVEGLRRAVVPWCVLPHQPVALNVDYPAQHPPVIDTRLASGLRKERPQPLDLHFRQPEQIARDPSPLWESESPRHRSIKHDYGPDRSRLWHRGSAPLRRADQQAWPDPRPDGTAPASRSASGQGSRSSRAGRS